MSLVKSFEKNIQIGLIGLFVGLVFFFFDEADNLG